MDWKNFTLAPSYSPNTFAAWLVQNTLGSEEKVLPPCPTPSNLIVRHCRCGHVLCNVMCKPHCQFVVSVAPGLAWGVRLFSNFHLSFDKSISQWQCGGLPDAQRRFHSRQRKRTWEDPTFLTLAAVLQLFWRFRAKFLRISPYLEQKRVFPYNSGGISPYSSVHNTIPWSLILFAGFEPDLVSYCEPGRGSEASSVHKRTLMRCAACAALRLGGGKGYAAPRTAVSTALAGHSAPPPRFAESQNYLKAVAFQDP